VTREPGAGSLGQAIRQILLAPGDLDPKAELMLFLADRANNMATVIRPALERGAWVLCDRHADSTVVYQGMARGMDPEFIARANVFATGGVRPDKVLLFDLEPRIGLGRIRHKDRLDDMPLEFHERVRAGFLKLAALDPGRWEVVDASQDPETVFRQVLRALELDRT
jgi:dTMP kinase